MAFLPMFEELLMCLRKTDRLEELLRKKREEKGKANVEVVDATGKLCPVPTQMAMKALERVSAGGIVKVISDSATSTDTVIRTVESHGHKIVDVAQEKGTFTITIEKKAG